MTLKRHLNIECLAQLCEQPTMSRFILDLIFFHWPEEYWNNNLIKNSTFTYVSVSLLVRWSSDKFFVVLTWFFLRPWTKREAKQTAETSQKAPWLGYCSWNWCWNGQIIWWWGSLGEHPCDQGESFDETKVLRGDTFYTCFHKKVIVLLFLFMIFFQSFLSVVVLKYC